MFEMEREKLHYKEILVRKKISINFETPCEILLYYCT